MDSEDTDQTAMIRLDLSLTCLIMDEDIGIVQAEDFKRS